MQIHWTFEGCNEEEINQIDSYWARKQYELEARIAAIGEVPSELRIAVEHSVDADEIWSVQAALHLPGNTLVAESSLPTPEKSINQVVRDLAIALDDVESVPPSFTAKRENLSDIVALLEKYRAQDRSKAFLSFLAPFVASLGPYVHHELAIRERAESIAAEQLSPSDVLDQLLVDAWEKFSQRNANRPIDLWLMQLADAAIERLQASPSERSLDEDLPNPDLDRGGWDADEWSDMVTYPDEIQLRDMLPAGFAIDAWDELDMELKQEHLSRMLAGLAHERRQAFLLRTVHGYNEAEIADFQSRSVQQVAEDIAAATTAITKYLGAEESTDPEEPFERRELRSFGRRRG